MRRVTLRPLGHCAVIEVDGALDVVSGHDLRQVFAEALHCTDGTLYLDLSRVTLGDDHGVAALTGCSDQAISARRVLMWSACSRPLVRDLTLRGRLPPAFERAGARPR